MTTERYIRIIAETFVLASLALGTFANHNWYCFGICWRQACFNPSSRNGA
jgi:hypothetical protein